MIVGNASDGFRSVREIQDIFNVPVSIGRVQQLLQKAYHLEYRLCARRNSETKGFQTQLHLCRSILRRTVFSDDKRFCLDGRDSLRYYKEDKGTKEQYYSCCQKCGDRLMVWGAISWRGNPDLALIDTRMNTNRYCRMIDDYMMPFIDEAYPNGCSFQQDNAVPIAQILQSSISWNKYWRL